MNKLLFRTVFFCLSVLSLCSCRQDDEADRGNESVDLVAVNIPIEGVRVESADSPLALAGSADTLTVTEELEDGFVLETSLLPVFAGLTRASSTTGLASDVQILCIAYKESGELYKYQYFTPGSPIIHLPKGQRFKLVFYSYNSTTKPDISKDITGSVSYITNGVLFSETAFLNDKTEIHTNNVMWGRIDLTPVIGSGINLPRVTFTHLFSRLDWLLRSVVGNITECSGRIRNTYKWGTIKLGNLVNVGEGDNGDGTWAGAGNVTYAAPVKFDAVGSADITSHKTVFCPNVGGRITLALNKITVGGKSFTGQRQTFPTRLKRGVDYRVVSTIKRTMTVTFNAAEGGTVTPKGAQTATVYGDRLESTANADAGFEFMGWYREGSKLENSVNEKINGNRITITVSETTEGNSYEARFEPAIEWAPGNLEYKDGEYIFNNQPGTAGSSQARYWFPGSDLPWGPATQPGTRGSDPCRLAKFDGGGWRMPTNVEMLQLRIEATETNYTVCKYRGVVVRVMRSAPFTEAGTRFNGDVLMGLLPKEMLGMPKGLPFAKWFRPDIGWWVPEMSSTQILLPWQNKVWGYGEGATEAWERHVGRCFIRCVRDKR